MSQHTPWNTLEQDKYLSNLNQKLDPLVVKVLENLDTIFSSEGLLWKLVREVYDIDKSIWKVWTWDKREYIVQYLSILLAFKKVVEENWLLKWDNSILTSLKEKLESEKIWLEKAIILLQETIKQKAEEILNLSYENTEVKEIKDWAIDSIHEKNEQLRLLWTAILRIKDEYLKYKEHIKNLETLWILMKKWDDYAIPKAVLSVSEAFAKSLADSSKAETTKTKESNSWWNVIKANSWVLIQEYNFWELEIDSSLEQLWLNLDETWDEESINKLAFKLVEVNQLLSDFQEKLTKENEQLKEEKNVLSRDLEMQRAESQLDKQEIARLQAIIAKNWYTW